MEERLAHLQMLQAIIARMAQCSFLIRGWSVTIVSALFVLSSAEANPDFVALAYFPVVAFWALDSYYLHQERLFRKLFEHAAAEDPGYSPFTMDTSLVSQEAPAWVATAFSKTELLFHGIVLGATVFVMLSL